MEGPDLTSFVAIDHNGCNFKPLDYISKAHLKVVVVSLTRISCKCPHLINSKFTYIKTRDLKNLFREFCGGFFER